MPITWIDDTKMNYDIAITGNGSNNQQLIVIKTLILLFCLCIGTNTVSDGYPYHAIFDKQLTPPRVTYHMLCILRPPKYYSLTSILIQHSRYNLYYNIILYDCNLKKVSV